MRSDEFFLAEWLAGVVLVLIGWWNKVTWNRVADAHKRIEENDKVLTDHRILVEGLRTELGHVKEGVTRIERKLDKMNGN